MELGEGQVTIDSDGQVFSGGQRVDQLVVVDFNRIQDLNKEGNSLYTYEGAEEDIVQPEEIQVKQGFWKIQCEPHRRDGQDDRNVPDV